MRALADRAPQPTLVFIFLAMAGVGIALGVFGFAANKTTGIAGIASLLIAAVGIVAAPWLAFRSRGGAFVCSALAITLEVVAALLLLTSPPSNSDLWVPINLGRFGGVLAGEMGLALSVHAAVLGRLGWGRATVLVLTNVLAVAIGVAIADWESRAGS
jgi:hypothetical protein